MLINKKYTFFICSLAVVCNRPANIEDSEQTNYKIKVTKADNKNDDDFDADQILPGHRPSPLELTTNNNKQVDLKYIF